MWQKHFGTAEFPQALLLQQERLTTFLRSDQQLAEGFGGALVAFNRTTGESQWQSPLPFVESDVLTLLGDGQLVYAVTGSGVSAYDTETGTRRWSLVLGAGHVEVAGEVDGQVVRVYYGDAVYEVGKDTGLLVSQRTRGQSLWQVGAIELVQDEASMVQGRDSVTQQLLWSSQLDVFRIDDPWTPQLAAAEALIVHTLRGDRGYCSLGIRTGQVKWCTDDIPLSNFSVDASQGTGYYLRNDFCLVEVRLEDGALLGSTQFDPPEWPGQTKSERSSYWVAADEGNVAVIFGDSNELFLLAPD